jgi:hypothetical protein
MVIWIFLCFDIFKVLKYIVFKFSMFIFIWKNCMFMCLFIYINFLCGVIVSMLPSSVVDCGFKTFLSHTKDYNICICYFSTTEQ